MLEKTHFQLFDLPASFGMDLARLEQHYRKLQSEVHPDRFASATPAERLHSIQLATQVNEAYQTLKSPLNRARYLLHLHGVDTQEETNTAMPAAFLMQQMEWREAIEEATNAADLNALDRLLRELRHEGRSLETQLGVMLDAQRDFEGAAEAVRKLRFLDKVRVEIEQAIETLDETL